MGAGVRAGSGAVVSRTAPQKRNRPAKLLTLSPEAWERLDAIAAARGTSRSGAVEQLIRRARLKSDGK